MQTLLKNLKKFFLKTDKILWLLTIIATVYSIILIQSMQRGYKYNYLTSQILAIIIGYLIALLLTFVDYHRIADKWILFIILSLGLLVLVFFIGINVTGTDDTAWIVLPGGLSFQPSEFVKIFFIISLSKHMQILQENDRLHSLLGVLTLLLHTAVPVVLIHAQGDDGTVLVFLFMFIIMAFVGGIQLRYFLIMILLIATAVPIAWNFILNEEQKNRFMAIFDLDGNAMTNYGWQQYQGKVSIASGGMSGTGLGNGARVSSGIVPEQENDFIFTVAGEELGFIGCLLLLAIILMIAVKIIIDAFSARDYLGKMLCVGVFAMISVQTIINIGMVLGLLPVIGITLPLFSSGGTSALAVLMGIGLVHSVHYHKDEVDAHNGYLKHNRYKYLSNTNYYQ
ncbi:MAG: FtsW/RodA/SpoVE family cell cycle protein [Ruminococcus sp.]|nr:FtsW/RodA/SpoVE family cell cycle protein [Ruminococcus sp.]